MGRFLWVSLGIYVYFYSRYVNAIFLKTDAPPEHDLNATLVNHLDHLDHLCDDALVHCFDRYMDLWSGSCEAIRSKLDLYKVKRQSNLLLTAKFQKLKTLQERRPKRSSHDRRLPADCAEAVLRTTNKTSGIYKIQPDPLAAPLYVYCETDRQGGDAWTMVQRRQSGAIDFHRNWREYQQGFGNLVGEFFIGLDSLHALTENKLQELWIHLQDFTNATCSARYSSFAIGGKQQSYPLNILGEYSGDCGDALRYHEGMKFSAKDANNDASENNCAELNRGGWWYNKCQECNLNSEYMNSAASAKGQDGRGVVWRSWHNHKKSLKAVQMAVRPIKSSGH